MTIMCLSLSKISISVVSLLDEERDVYNISRCHCLFYRIILLNFLIGDVSTTHLSP